MIRNVHAYTKSDIINMIVRSTTVKYLSKYVQIYHQKVLLKRSSL